MERCDPSSVSFADTFSHKGRRKRMQPDFARPPEYDPRRLARVLLQILVGDVVVAIDVLDVVV
ncbi:MAG TPA: hypothetical protein PKC36_04130, partial [Dietzia sp.]|nr:hypothetical protein [Dietzia sp.]